jgi:hypothetical protein
MTDMEYGVCWRIISKRRIGAITKGIGLGDNRLSHCVTQLRFIIQILECLKDRGNLELCRVRSSNEHPSTTKSGELDTYP